MNQQPFARAPSHTSNPESSCTMDLTGVMPQHIQSSENAPRRQPPPQLPFQPSTPSSHPLPSIPPSTRFEPALQHFSSNNNEHRIFYDTNHSFTSHSNQHSPFYDTNYSSYPLSPASTPAYHSDYNNINVLHNFLSPTLFSPQRYLLPTSLPTLTEPSTPSSPTYIPILTGRLDWCPWSEALTMAVIGMNLFGHIAEHHDSQWGFDPGSVPTYPPVIHQNSSLEEIQTWNIWWIRDGQVLHLLVSRLSPTVRSQLPGTSSSQPRRRTARSVYREIVCLFGGTDFNSAAVIRDELIALHCAPSCISDYVSRWRSGLNHLASAGHPFDHVDSLRHFVKHLPYGSTYDIIRESVLYALSTARTAAQLPSFESVIERVMNVELNQAYFQPSRARHLHSNTSSMTTPSSENTTTTPFISTTHSSSQPRPLRSANFCTGCCQTGHTVDKHGGGQEGGVTNWNKSSACAYRADVDVDLGDDGGAASSDHSPPTLSVALDDVAPTPFAAFGVLPTALSLIDKLFPICLLSVSPLYNSILDSGCTTHIIRDRSLFWTYHTSMSVPVKTANCGILETLAKGDVKFRVQCGTQSVIFTLRDCLHAPSAPINLLSVGAMQERRMRIHFDEDTTVIHFPSDHPILAGLTVQATVL